LRTNKTGQVVTEAKSLAFSVTMTRCSAVAKEVRHVLIALGAEEVAHVAHRHNPSP